MSMTSVNPAAVLDVQRRADDLTNGDQVKILLTGVAVGSHHYYALSNLAQGVGWVSFQLSNASFRLKSTDLVTVGVPTL